MQPLDQHAVLAELILALPLPAHIGVIVMLCCAVGAAILPPATADSPVLWQLLRRVIDVIGLNVLNARNAGASITKLPEPSVKAGDLVKGKKKSVLEERL